MNIIEMLVVFADAVDWQALTSNHSKRVHNKPHRSDNVANSTHIWQLTDSQDWPHSEFNSDGPYKGMDGERGGGGRGETVERAKSFDNSQI